MALPRGVLPELQRIVGQRHVVHDRHDLKIFERDGSIAGALPDAVVLPATRDEVVAVVRLAARHGIPVVPRGAGTGLSGGAVTLKGGIALQLSRMRRILEIDPETRTAVVEPGVDHDALAGVDADPRAVGAEDPRLRHGRQPLADPEVEMVE